MSDFNQYMYAQETTRRRFAEYARAQTALDLAYYEERMAELISQYEPVGSIGIDRDKLRSVFHYVRTGRLPREANDESSS